MAAYRCHVRRIGSALHVLLGLALLLALVGAIGWLIYTTVTEAPVVVAAVVTGILAILGLGVQRYFEQQREDARIRRDRMAPIYEQLVSQLHLIAGGSIEQSDVETFFGELAQSLQLWGAPPVIKAFNSWRSMTTEDAAEGEVALNMLFAYEDLLLVTRADLGVTNDELERGDLLRIFINDLDEHLLSAENAADAKGA
jgi:hypothetical protein